jgi:hypothetical protein
MRTGTAVKKIHRKIPRGLRRLNGKEDEKHSNKKRVEYLF